MFFLYSVGKILIFRENATKMLEQCSMLLPHQNAVQIMYKSLPTVKVFSTDRTVILNCKLRIQFRFKLPHNGKFDF